METPVVQLLKTRALLVESINLIDKQIEAQNIVLNPKKRRNLKAARMADFESRFAQSQWKKQHKINKP